MKIILLVEDDDMSRDMLSRRLAKLGYVLIEARNGVEAIEAAQTKNPDLILENPDLILSGFDFGLSGFDFGWICACPGWAAWKQHANCEVT
jgi:CheY-like chemotaxis protein